MAKRLLPLIFLLPLAASAECGFVHGAQGMTIVVGAKTDRCFHSESFSTAFRTGLVSAVQAMDQDSPVAVRNKRPIDARNARSAKLWRIAEHQHQRKLANAPYYGQR